MKTLLYLMLFTLFSLSASAQAATDTASSFSVLSEENAKYYYGKSSGRETKEFEVKHDKVIFRRAYRVNTARSAEDVYNRALEYARNMNTDFRESKNKKIISFPFTWKYYGGSNHCIENLDLKARVILEFKGVKTRISFTDVTYTHLDKDSDEQKPVARSDFFSKRPDCAPAEGKIELLYNCDQCPKSTDNLDKSLKNEFEMLADRYQDSLRD